MMFNLIRKKKMASEKGQALILVLVILTLGSLFIPPLLSLIGTGVKTGTVYDTKTTELYAADAGIQDAVWQVKYDHIKDFTNPVNYSPYDYVTSWPYSISSVNNMPVNVTIQNLWIPSNIAQPNEATASSIATGGKLIVTGTMIQTGLLADDGTTQISQYRMNFAYYPEAGWSLLVDSIGVWLPRGFTYFSDANHKSSLEDTVLYPNPANQATLPILGQPWAGNEAVLWTFGANPTFESFVNDPTEYPLVLQVTFYFAPPQDAPAKKPDAVAWINTPNSTPLGTNVPYSWDASFVVFKLTSTAVSSTGSTTVESYSTKSELQKLASSVNGDYWATGNTLMRDAIPDGGHIRDTWLNAADHSSSATVPLETNPGDGDGIPVDADVAAAYLYWTSWFSESNKVAVAPLNPDTCSNFNNWNNGSAWAISPTNNYFRAQYNGAGASSRDLILQNFINLSAYTAGKVTVSWDQWTTFGGTGNQTMVPTADGDISGTWNTSITQTQTRVPTGDGDIVGTWDSAPRWDDVDETTADDSDYITGITNSGTNYCMFTFSPFSIPSGATITSVRVYIRAGDVVNGSNNVRECVNVDGSYYVNSSNRQPPNTPNLTTWYYEWATNPDTGAAWTVDDINGTGSNPLEQFGVRSTDGSPDFKVSMVYAEVTYTGATNLYASVDETTADDSDYITGTTDAGGYALFTFSPFSIPAGSTIIDLTIYIRAGDDSNGNNNIRERIKVNDNYYNGSTSHNPGTSFNTYSYSWSNNPNTSAAWTVNDINGTGSNPLQQIGVYSTDLNPDMRVSMVYAEVNYTSPITASDGLDYAISYDGGVHWTANIEAFRDDIVGTENYAYDIPSQYITNQFMIKFTLVGFGGAGQYCNIDNIKIMAMAPDNQVFFKIDGQQVYFDAAGDPQAGAQQITADRVQVIRNITSGTSMGFSYSCYKDVTDLVRAFSAKAPDPAMNYPGAGIYTVGDVNGTLGNNSTNEHQLAHAGWSLIIIYEGSTTLGHQLYLYDNFTYADDYSDLVFDGDASKGGSTISGFIVPQPIVGETEAAKLTVFVGEGDDWIPGEFIAFNAPEIYWADPTIPSDAVNIPNSYKLWDGTTSVTNPSSNTSAQPNNVWNGLSLVTSADGIDIDTFHIPWSSGMLSPGDTSAHIDIYTVQDNWNLVYVIISFRSSVTTGGSLMYLIKTN